MKNLKNLGEVLKRIENPDYAKKQLAEDRNRIAKLLKDARKRLLTLSNQSEQAVEYRNRHNREFMKSIYGD
jgi:ElaB/YqjD/DUF883 family membrane-anchored ribosome-binding protein